MRGLFYIMMFIVIYSAAFFIAGVMYDRVYYRPIMEKEYCEILSKGGKFRCEDNWIAEIVPKPSFFKVQISAEEDTNGRAN